MDIYNAPIDFSVGDVITSKSCGDFIVTENKSSRDVSVKFVNTGTEIRGLQRGNVIRGAVHDHMYPSVEGVGFIGKPKSEVCSRSVCYDRWKKMIVRCYSENYHSTRESYKDCTVCDEWLNYSNFEVWFNDNYVTGYDLDKDLLVQGNRIYSPDTCSFVPPQLNTWIVEKNKGDCEMGVSRRRHKRTKEFNGLFNVAFGGKYLGRFNDKLVAEDRYREFKKLFFEEYADLLESKGMLTTIQAEALRTRKT